MFFTTLYLTKYMHEKKSQLNYTTRQNFFFCLKQMYFFKLNSQKRLVKIVLYYKRETKEQLFLFTSNIETSNNTV